MKTRKDLVFAVLVTFCLTATLFMIRASWSGGEWDPWVDIKEDGTVDIYDAITLANAYGTSGDTTKNVSITDWRARDLVLVNVSACAAINFSDAQVVSPYTSWFIEVPTLGYRKVTVGVLCPTAAVDVTISWGVGSSSSHYYQVENWTDTKEWRQYDVAGRTLRIEIYNTQNYNNWIYYDYYLST